MPVELSPARVSGCMADYTRPELMVPRLNGTDPAGIIKELCERLFAHESIGDRLAFYDAAVNHEFLSSSALPAGVAIPHARSDRISRLTLVVGRTGKPVAWGGKGSWPVEHVFLIAVPSTDALEHLALLSGIAGFIRRPEMLARLRAAADAREMFEVLKEISVTNG